MSRGVGTASSAQGGMSHGKERKNPWKHPSNESEKRQASHRNRSLTLWVSPLRSLQAYEAGEYPLPFDKAKALADLYGCSIAAFAETEGGGEA